MPPLPLARNMIIFSPKAAGATATVKVTTSEAVLWFRMPTIGPVQTDLSKGKPEPATGFVEMLQAGVYGYVTFQPSAISNPDPSTISTIVATSKDPWPDPPSAPRFAGFGADWPDRYHAFLMSLAGDGPKFGVRVDITPYAIEGK